MTDPFVGIFSFVRVYSGQLNRVLMYITLRKGTKERISRLLKDACK